MLIHNDCCPYYACNSCKARIWGRATLIKENGEWKHFHPECVEVIHVGTLDQPPYHVHQQ